MSSTWHPDVLQCIHVHYQFPSNQFRAFSRCWHLRHQQVFGMKQTPALAGSTFVGEKECSHHPCLFFKGKDFVCCQQATAKRLMIVLGGEDYMKWNSCGVNIHLLLSLELQKQMLKCNVPFLGHVSSRHSRSVILYIPTYILYFHHSSDMYSWPVSMSDTPLLCWYAITPFSNPTYQYHLHFTCNPPPCGSWVSSKLLTWWPIRQGPFISSARTDQTIQLNIPTSH